MANASKAEKILESYNTVLELIRQDCKKNWFTCCWFIYIRPHNNINIEWTTLYMWNNLNHRDEYLVKELIEEKLFPEDNLLP